MTNSGEFRARGAGKFFLVLTVVIACSCGAGRTPTTPAAPPPAPPATPAPAAAPAAAPAEAEPEAASPKDEAAPAASHEERMRAGSSNAYSQHADDLETAQAELERARVELNRALTVRAPRPSSGGGAPAAASRGAAADAAPPAKAEKKSAESSCSTACRAFASLERAASAVCRITGEKDGRCSHAHAVLADAKQRVAVCTCTSE